MSNQELELLLDVLNTQSEAEAGGVKYIWMDENTIYRFENNRMKKVSAGLIKKARKLQQQNTTKDAKPKKSKQLLDEEEEEVEVEVKPKKSKRVLVDDESGALSRYGEAEDEDEPLIVKPKKQNKLTRASKTSNVESPIDLSEYWQVKSKLEFQNQELERYKNKVSKLKQYKNIVSRLTGGEYDQPITTTNNAYSQLPQQQQIAETGPRHNDSLFMFGNPI